VALALARGEWCLVSEIDFFPRRLKQWLIDCNVVLIRCFGRGRISGEGGGVLPGVVNGYVTEDGLIFYCAEDGSTFYVQET
jgi:hypothetical protein